MIEFDSSCNCCDHSTTSAVPCNWSIVSRAEVLFASDKKPVLFEAGTDMDGTPYVQLRIEDRVARLTSVAEINMFLQDMQQAVSTFMELQDETGASDQADGFAE